MDLCKDRSLTLATGAARGLRLAELEESGHVRVMRVVPTTGRYTVGRFVSNEWQRDASFDEELYYLDASTRLPKLAFVRSEAFRGREYPEQWGLLYRIARMDL